MADDLQTIVQRMIDAGEPEANIAAVIQHFKSQSPIPPKNPPAMMGGGIPVQYSQVPNADMPLVGAGMAAATTLPAGIAAAPSALRMIMARPILAKSLGIGAVGAARQLGESLGVPPWLINSLATGAGAAILGAKGGEPDIPLPRGVEPSGSEPAVATPTRMVGARMAGTPSGSNFSLSVPSPSGMASLEAAAPVADRPVGQPSPNAFVPVKSINPADMPRDWHAFLDPEARAAADPLERAQAAGLHKETMANDARYRAATALERAQFQANPPNIQDLLLGLLTRPGGQ